MPLVNMKRAEVEQNGGTLLGEPVDASKEDYFYGLRISLEEPELKKLNLGDNPKVGSKVAMNLVGKLVSYSIEEQGRNATIQIIELGLAEPKQEDRTEVLYSAKVES